MDSTNGLQSAYRLRPRASTACGRRRLATLLASLALVAAACGARTAADPTVVRAEEGPVEPVVAAPGSPPETTYTEPTTTSSTAEAAADAAVASPAATGPTLPVASPTTMDTGPAAAGSADRRPAPPVRVATPSGSPPTDTTASTVPAGSVNGPAHSAPSPTTAGTAPASTAPTTAPPATTAPTTAGPPRVPDPAGGRPTTGAVIDPADPSVLFFSDNDDCTGIEAQQRHPDWVQGQPGSGRNDDGTPTFGYAYNTGDASKGEINWGFHPTSIALSGDCVLAMGVADAYGNKRAVRIFRRYDRQGRYLPGEAYYSVWYYFPTEVSYDSSGSVGGTRRWGYWNVFQIKNEVGGDSLANLSINAGKLTGASAMEFRIGYKSPCGGVEECDDASTINAHTSVPIPVGRWVHFELYLKSSTGPDGRLTAWQDGREIIDFTGQTERTGSSRRTWSVNNYGQLHRPSSHTLYVDDALISTRPVHPLLFG